MILSLTPSLFANAQVTAGTTQLNQINFDPVISLSEVREYLKNNQFKNLKSASIVADLETKDFVLPLNLDLNLEDDSNNSKTTASYQSTKKAIIDGIRQAKKDINKSKQKFDSKKLLESFQVSSSSTLPVGAKLADEVANLPKPPAPTLPTEEELKYYEDNGVLPPIKVDPEQIKKLIKDSGLPENYPVPHLDPIQKGKFSNSRPEDVYNSMTPAEKATNQKKVDEAKLQEELVKGTTEEELQTVEKTTKTDELKISQLNYYTEVGDSNAKDTATKAQKPNSKEAKEENKPKLQRNDEARKNKQSTLTNKKNSKKIEDKVKDTVTQDITSLFKVSDEETNRVKAETEKQKQNWLNNTKTNKQQLNEYEAQGYAKEGLDLTTLNVDVIDSNTNKPKTKSQVQDLVNKEKKVSSLGDLLKFGLIKAEARGLSNNRYSTLIYSQGNESYSLSFDTQNYGQPAYYRPTSGQAGQQRFCFNNNKNTIELTNSSTCEAFVSGTRLCLDVYGGNFQNGTTIGLWECHTGSSEKWIMDESGRIASKDRPDMCIDGFGGNIASGTPLKLWGCHTGSNQAFRAGYNNFGQNMSMTIWALRASGNFNPLATSTNMCDGICENGYNGPGHSFIEMTNQLGTHNTFSRWDFNDTSCDNYSGNYPSVNNMCDGDKITVDVEYDVKDPYTRSTKYSRFKNKYQGLIKQYWDYLVFGSGFRSNYRFDGNYIDLGSSGTYDWLSNSKSRFEGYNANYGVLSGGNILNTNYTCSGQTIKFWNAAFGYNNIQTGTYSGNIAAMSPSSVYYQI